MQLPVPPTDSVYKFLCISALLAGISLFIWSDKQVTALEQREAEYRKRHNIAGAEFHLLKRDLEAQENRVEELQRAPPEIRKRELPAITDALNKLEARGHAFVLKDAELAADERELDRLAGKIREGSTFRIIQSITCLLIFASSLGVWYKKIQYHQDRMLRAQADAAESAAKNSNSEKRASGAATNSSP